MDLQSNSNTLTLFKVETGQIEKVFKEIQLKCEFLSAWGINILVPALTGYTKSIVLETNYVCKDYRNLYSNFYSKKFSSYPKWTNRLHFFSIDLQNENDVVINSEKYQPEYIGFSIVRPVVNRCLSGTVLDPWKIGKTIKDGHYCLRTCYKVHINGAKYTVEGYPFVSQDTDVTVCAHSALWGVCRYLSERYKVYGEIYPYDLIKMTGKNEGRPFPYRGMTYQDYSMILSEFGVYPILLRLKHGLGDAQDPTIFQELYSYMESGFPILASLPNHVVSIIGHTLNLDKIPKYDKNGFSDSSCYLGDVIIMDDNLSPYRLLGEKPYPMPDNFPPEYKKLTIKSIHSAVAPLPEKAFLNAKLAREKALTFLMKKKEEFKKITDKNNWIIRLFLTTCVSFKNRKLMNFLENKTDQLLFLVTSINLPHFVWVMELSTEAQYKANRCFGEIVLDATSGRQEDSQIYMRIGRDLYWGDSKHTEEVWPIEFPQFIHNLGEKGGC